MESTREIWRRAAWWLTAGSAVAILFSIAVSHVLLPASILCLLIARSPLELPPIKLPLFLFLAGTIISLVFSPDPHAGLPQLKKFFVFLVLVAVYTSIRRVTDIRLLIFVWAALATASGLWSFAQFFRKRELALASGVDFYATYVSSRVTGFMSHWMTFGAEMMITLLMIAAILFFAPQKKYVYPLLIAGLIIGAALVISLTRSVWLGAAIGFGYLVTMWRPKLLALAPVVLASIWAVSPDAVKERAVSVYQPHGELDSNEHRQITRRVGWRMIKAHPWLGLGPDRVQYEFMKYLPPDVPLPLPAGFYGHLHNFYLQYGADRGVPTLLALLWLLGKVLYDFIRGARALPADEGLRKAILHGAAAAVIAILVEGLFEYNLGDSEVLTMFLVAVAWGYTALRGQPQPSAEEIKLA